MTLRLASKEEILAKIQEKNVRWFRDQKYVLGQEEFEELDENEEKWKAEGDFYRTIPTVEERNDGDGNDAYLTIHFKEHDMYVSLTGTYSSWDSTNYHRVFQSVPYTYTETRFKPFTVS